MSALVVLRPLSLSDAPDIFRLLADDQEGIEQTATIPWPFTEADAEAWLNRVTRMDGVFAILVNGEFAGSCGITEAAEDEHAAVLGYWVGAPFRGQGVATQAVALLIKIAKLKGRRRVLAEVLPGNIPSETVLVRHGFRKTGAVDRELPVRGGRRLLHTYELELR